MSTLTQLPPPVQIEEIEDATTPDDFIIGGFFGIVAVGLIFAFC